MEKKILKKILVIAIVFILTFSNCGYTLQALATSEGLSIFGFNLFGSNMLEFKAYFGDNQKEKSNIVDVNSEANITVELNPKEEGYLKSGTIQAITEEGEINFAIKEVSIEQENSNDQLTQIFAPDTTLLKTEQVLNIVNENDHSTSNVENQQENIFNVLEDNKVENEVKSDNYTTITNTITNNVSDNVANDSEKTSDSADDIMAEIPTDEIKEDFIDEDTVVNDKIEKESEETEKVANIAQVRIVSENEITIENVIEPTKLHIKVQFNQSEKLDILDLYKAIKLQLSGKYIDVDLKEIEVSAEQKLDIGWSYTKDIEVSSEYTKVSPFEVADTKGTLVENKIVVKRNIEDEKYLPLKQTKVEIEVPELNGKKPVAMEVNANKLKATRGEEISEVVFTNDNWKYDENKNILTISVENTECNYTYGEDIYVITYRYEDYVEENEIKLETIGKVTVEEFSGKDNNVISKDLKSEQKIVVNVGELITYSIGTTEETINKGKINANYNSAEPIYETEFATTVNISILTNDVLSEFTLKDTKEFYIDKQNLEFETQDVKYKKIKFKYEEISELLEKGGTIEIKSNSGELLYTLNSELIKTQENCEIEIRGEVSGVEISFKNITVNGNIAVDFVKYIKKCSFDKSAFASFEKIESRIKAEVKYMSEDAGTELEQIKTEKYFENSFTRAEVELDRDILSTIEKNENVEIKIVLNNHLETSDLYSNPVFELVFPKYVTNVEPKITNLLYEDELRVKSTVTYKDENIVKMQIALEGVQTRFSTGTLTNGTNIIVSANIEVDNYTPKRTDQIRMYYYNESVSNYESQTKWTVKKDIPTGIIKNTNGFDVDVFTFQAPNGFVTVNEIQNYDGANGSVASIKQGEETREVAMEIGSQTAKMKLIAMNNTGNNCTDVMLLGRIPVKDATDVKTGEKLGNNIDTIMTSMITPADNNPISSTIYYSANANATKDMHDGNNAWTETPEDVTQMKSFLIVITGTVLEGTVYEYTYDFQIPANLPYEAKMYGSFGAFYNNHSDVAVVYENSVADKVGLFTKAGPKVEATMSVDIGDGADVLEERMIEYTITVKNTGSVDLENVKVVNQIPMMSYYCTDNGIEDASDNGYVIDYQRTLEWNYEKINAGEIVEEKFKIRTSELPETLEEYCNMIGAIEEDENGHYNLIDNEKQYVTSIPEKLYIENNATVKIENLAKEIETNTVKNRLLNANFDINTNIFRKKGILESGDTFEYVVSVRNISNKDLTNVVITDVLPKELKFIGFDENRDSYKYDYNEKTNTLKLLIDELKDEDVVKAYLNCEIANMKNTGKATSSNQMIVSADDVTDEKSVIITADLIGPQLTVNQDLSLTSQNALEYESFNIIINVKNDGEGASKKVQFKTVIPDEFEVQDAEAEGNRQIIINAVGNVVTGEVDQIDAGKYSSLVIKVRPKLLKDNEVSKKVTIRSEVKEDYIGELEVKSIDINIVQNPVNPKTDEEKKEEEDDRTYSDPEDNDNYLDEIEKDNIVFDNNSNIENDNNVENKSDSNENINEENNEIVAITNDIKIYGQVWLDENKNGQKDEYEKYISKVKVQLQENGNTVKAVTTDSTGKYRFEDLPAGKYSVLFEYDSNKYVATTYKKQDIEENVNSDAIELTEGTAVTNNYQIESGEQQLDLGLQDRNNFDIAVNKYITKAIVKTKNKEKVYEYDNLDLAKLEIRSKELKNTSITLEYKIVVENIGNVKGKCNTIIDYLPKELTFNSESNKNWVLNEDGTLYNNTLKDIDLNPGEKKEIILVISKQMTEDNTGVVSNKVGILDCSTETGIKENASNNQSTQEIIISVSTGKVVGVIFTIVLVILAFLLGYGTKNNKIKCFKIQFNKNLKRVYK